MTRVLVVDDEEEIREALRFLLEDAGYDVIDASSLDSALELIDREPVQLILTDLFIGRQKDALAALQTLQRRAAPTPVGLVTAWNVSMGETQRAEFAFVVAKPFDIDQLLTQVAASLRLPLTEEQERQALVVRQYFAALTARDWDALMNLCTDDVTYILPGLVALSGTYVGKQAFRAYTEETFAQFLDTRFEDVQIYASPSGLTSRYRGTWRMPDGSEPVLMGAVHFQFAGDRIKQIGVSLNDKRLEALMRQPQMEESSPQSTTL